jgi:hypothetical protein
MLGYRKAEKGKERKEVKGKQLKKVGIGDLAATASEEGSASAKPSGSPRPAMVAKHEPTFVKPAPLRRAATQPMTSSGKGGASKDDLRSAGAAWSPKTGAAPNPQGAAAKGPPLLGPAAMGQPYKKATPKSDTSPSSSKKDDEQGGLAIPIPELDDKTAAPVKAVHHKMKDMMKEPVLVRKKTFKDLLVEHHPDKNSSEHATEVFQAVNNARSWFLQDPDQEQEEELKGPAAQRANSK